MNDENTINLEISTYDNLIEQKLTELKIQKDKEWDEYQQKLDELQKEYNDKIDKIEESEILIEMFRNLNSDNVTIERIEDLANSLENMDLSEEEMLVVMSRLIELSSNDLIQENILEEEETPIEIEQPIVQKSNKEIEKEIRDEYNKIAKEVERINQIRKEEEPENNYYDAAVNIGANDNIEKTPEQREILNNYLQQAGTFMTRLTAIDADYAYIQKAIEIGNTKSIVNNKSEIYSHLERIKETINEIDELLPGYKMAYQKLEEAFKHQEEVLEETVEELEEEPEKKLEKENQVEAEKEHEVKNKEDEENTEYESKVLEELPEQEDNNAFMEIDPIVIEEYERTYGEALKLLANYKKAVESNLIAKDSYLHGYFSALELMTKDGFRNDVTEDEIKAMINNLQLTIDPIEASVDGELKNALFPVIDAQHINIGDKNVIIFLDNNGDYLIEDDLNSMKSGDRTKAANELRKAIETKYTVRSWNNDLRFKSDNLKGSKIKVGAKTYEARNCKCGTGSTRMSIWPVSLNPVIKEKIKSKYELDDNFENVLLVCGIDPNHKIDEHLKTQINSNSKRITEIDELFSNPNTDFKDIEALIDGSSNVCGKVFESGTGQRV